MKTKLVTLLTLSFLVIPTTQAQSIDPDLIAGNIVYAANVKPGEVVGIIGGRHHFNLIESTAIEASIAGGHAAMLMISNRYIKEYWEKVPMKYLAQKNPINEWLKTMDVYIGVHPAVDPSIYNDIPRNRLAAVSQANLGLSAALNSSKLRAIAMHLPTQALAAQYNLDFDVYAKMHLAAIDADYIDISRKSADLATLLKPGSTVEITSEHGTSIQFRLIDRPIFRQDGFISDTEANSSFVLHRVESLPTGQILLAPDETSAFGTVKIPQLMCRNQLLTNVTFTFVEGEVTNFTADEGAQCYHLTMVLLKGDKNRLGFLSLGINPAYNKYKSEANGFMPPETAGMVTIGTGANEALGGINVTTSSYHFPIKNATVIIDGKVLVRNGELQELGL